MSDIPPLMLFVFIIVGAPLVALLGWCVTEAAIKAAIERGWVRGPDGPVRR